MGSVGDTKRVDSVPLLDRRIELVDRFIDEPRPLRVAVIGGGLTGITAGILLPAKVPGIQLTIYEKNEDFGGTWLENKYPGVRCDIPSHVYQSTFAPKTDWTDQFSYGPEIREYWQGVARQHDVYQYAQFGKRVEAADWDDEAGVWTLTIEDVATGTRTATVQADAVVTAVGRFNAWKLPDYPGISEFQGLLRHTSDWDPSFDPTGKRVAVIGNGASGIQVVPALQKIAVRVDHYARSRTWIATSWAGDERTPGPQPIEESTKAALGGDAATYLRYRKELEAKYWRRFGTFLRDDESESGRRDNEALRTAFSEVMRRRIGDRKPELLADLVPDFAPNCRRLTPGPGYLEALTADNVDYVRTPIARFTASGIETTDGVQRDVDAVFCATGANVDMVPAFAVRARGQDLRTVWGADGTPGSYGFPYTYLGAATPGFPNLFFVQGPHAAGPSGTVPHAVETQLTYVAQVLRKIGREGIKAMMPSTRAADDFVVYARSFFDRTVLTDNCSSWYNSGRPGSFVHGLWPGSAGHLSVVRRSPRWEDWEYDYLGGGGADANRFAWYFGNGWTRDESNPEADLVSYLKLPGEVALKDLHEVWWDLP
ncbi:flavin-binding monooxygenase [Grosmannia clavigera kw1407]|uniref:Flavin-binding monooxygenase n=1 Tax=Grosmannia clavigera (strain kw1407 / UAMH 11150) TaxID=655863 RepID=F0XNM7_GROCL|nr:flavin-binding monooxygenase [Grosmannia clavigera kw1407]EFX00603.1 flavin-binding monooxygenase [Grosmannia clavigera kw1407]